MENEDFLQEVKATLDEVKKQNAAKNRLSFYLPLVGVLIGGGITFSTTFFSLQTQGKRERTTQIQKLFGELIQDCYVYTGTLKEFYSHGLIYDDEYCTYLSMTDEQAKARQLLVVERKQEKYEQLKSNLHDNEAKIMRDYGMLAIQGARSGASDTLLTNLLNYHIDWIDNTTIRGCDDIKKQSLVIQNNKMLGEIALDYSPILSSFLESVNRDIILSLEEE